MTVVCIEDNEANVRVLEATLAMFGVRRSLVARTGPQGWSWQGTHQPHVVLLDLHLPDLSGEELVRKLAADPQTAGMPIIVISAVIPPIER